MQRKWMAIAAVALVVVTLGLTLRSALGQETGPDGARAVLAFEREAENERAIYAPDQLTQPDSPAISFITTNTAYCYQPDPRQDVCYVNYGEQYVDAAPSYMITMTVMLDNRYVARYAGFFQTSLYASHSFHSPGFKVACGALGSSGVPDWGKGYSFVIRARDSTGLTSANYGTVYCPAYIP